MGPYVQDALDLVEFANGPGTSRWGGLRARMGHPRPFGMKYLGIGNEQWGPDYIPRYEAFSRALKARHPEILLVGSAGPGPTGERFDFLWQRMREAKADLVDEHYYMSPAWFRENAGRYDRYPRTGPKVFAGEYAAQSVGVVRPENRNNWECALSEAAFLTGLERNADVVTMTSYAPLLAHVDAWQWTPNLIWFDNLRSYGTPSYQVQKLFGTNRGARVLPVDLPGGAANGTGGLYASAAQGEGGEVILKLVNTTARSRDVRVEAPGAAPPRRAARATVLASADLRAENSLAEPDKVAPREERIARSDGGWNCRLEPYSVVVLRL
jgi:alpha-N-arabinofuranosidase